MRKVRRKKITPRLCSLGSSVWEQEKHLSTQSTYTIDTRLATGEVIQLQQAAIRTRSHFSGAGHRPACQAGGFKAMEAGGKSVSLQCSFTGMNFQQRPWLGASAGTGEPKKIRLRLFRLGASNRIPIPQLLSLSILISNIINFLLWSRELLHDRIPYCG